LRDPAIELQRGVAWSPCGVGPVFGTWFVVAVISAGCTAAIAIMAMPIAMIEIVVLLYKATRTAVRSFLSLKHHFSRGRLAGDDTCDRYAGRILTSALLDSTALPMVEKTTQTEDDNFPTDHLGLPRVRLESLFGRPPAISQAILFLAIVRSFHR
jgi:hypothetical protein